MVDGEVGGSSAGMSDERGGGCVSGSVSPKRDARKPLVEGSAKGSSGVVVSGDGGGLDKTGGGAGGPVCRLRRGGIFGGGVAVW